MTARSGADLAEVDDGKVGCTTTAARLSRCCLLPPGEEDVVEGRELNCSLCAMQMRKIAGSQLLLRHKSFSFFSS
jgi:hypothetical protein